MLVLALMGNIFHQTFKMKCETCAYGIDFEIENVFKNSNKKN